MDSPLRLAKVALFVSTAALLGITDAAAQCPPGTGIRQTQMFTNMSPAQTPPWTPMAIPVPKFDASGGKILIKAEVTVEGEVNGGIQAQNLSTLGGCLLSSSIESSLNFNGPIPGLQNITLGGLGQSFSNEPLAIFSPPINDFTTPPTDDTVQHLGLNGSGSESFLFDDPAFLNTHFIATFPGEQIPLTHEAADDGGHTGCGNLLYISNNTTQAKVTVVYTFCQNTPPIANDDAAQICTGGSVDIPVLQNDFDPSGGTLNCSSLVITQNPLHGTATVIAGCSAGAPCPGVCIRYVSTDPGFTGVDNFTYRVLDNINRPDTANVAVTVCSVTAGNDSATVCRGSGVDIAVLANDASSCGPLNCASLTILSQPLHGVVTIDPSCSAGSPCPGLCLQYVSTDLGFAGQDSFTYGISNGLSPACSAVGTVTIGVCATNAADDSATVCSGASSSIAVLANDSTTCGVLDCASLIVTVPPLHGTASVQGCTGTGACAGCVVVYTANAGYTGPDSFTYRVANNQSPACRDSGMVAVNVCATTATNDAATVCAGANVSIPVLANDSTSCGVLNCASLTITTPPLHGTTSIQGCTGTGACAGCVIVYTPAGGYTGPDSFVYRVGNNQTPACTGFGTVALTVCSTIAAPDAATVCAGSSTSISVLANDSTSCGVLNCASLAITAQPLHGTASIQGCAGTGACAGCVVVYTPAAGYTGPDSFGYVVGNNQSPACLANGAVTLTVCATIANTDAASVCSGSNVSIPVLANDTTSCGVLNCASLVITTPPLHGTASIQGCAGTGACAGCVVVYTPSVGYTGPDSFGYTVANNQTPACLGAGLVNLTVCAVNAVDDTRTVCAGTTALIPVQVNDTTGCGLLSCASIVVTSQPLHGTATVQGCTGTQPCGGCAIAYVPAPGYTGPDSFTYSICNNQVPACCDTAVVSLTVCATTAVTDTATVCAGSSTSIPVLANDTTSCGVLNCASLAITTQPLHGTASIQGCTGTGACAGCVVVYTPTAGYTGPDTFGYSVANNQNPACSGNGLVNLTVCATIALDESASVCSGSNVSIPVLANDTTSCGLLSCASLTITTPPLHGTAAIQGCTGTGPCAGCVVVYTPSAGYTGPDSFAYRVGNNQTPACLDTATVTLNVCAVIALDDARTLCAGTNASIAVLANDTAGCGILNCASLTITTQPLHGTASIQGCAGTGACAGCVVVYTPSAGYVGPDSFGYSVANNQNPACSDSALVNLTICRTDAVNDSASVCAGSSTSIPVLANDTTSCGVLNCASLAITTQPLHGTASIQGCTGTGACAGCVVVYTPSAGYTGPDTFGYTVANNQATPCGDSAVVNLTVCRTDAVNDAATVCAGGSLSVAVLANDTTSCGVLNCASIAITAAPLHGTAVIQGCTGTGACAGCRIVYTPAAGYAGPDNFSYSVANTQAPVCTDTATVSMTVCATIALDDSAEVCSGEETTIAVLTNDSTTCGPLDCSSLVILTPPAHGIASVVNNCGSGVPCPGVCIRYVSENGYFGPDTLTYRVTSVGGCQSGPATVAINVKASPNAIDDKFIKEPGVSDPVVITILANDTPGSGCTLLPTSVVITEQPQHGTILGVDPATGAVTYDPDPSFPGSDSFCYSVTNSCGCTDEACAEINEPPGCEERNRRVCGSLLLYPEFDNRPGVVTMLTVTDGCCDMQGDAKIEFRFINKDNCLKADQTFTLTPCDTVTMLTSAVNSGGPSARGYVYAYAKNTTVSPNNPTGTPIVYNHLIGNQLILNGITSLNYGMNAVSFRGLGGLNGPDTDGLANDDDGDGIRDLNGPGNALPEYEEAPDKILIPRFLAVDDPAAGPVVLDSEIIVINLTGGGAFTAVVDILGYNDNEEPLSAFYSFKCWDKPKLRTFAPFTLQSFLAGATLHDPDEIVGLSTRESGWMILDGLVANSSGPESIDDPAIYAVLVEGIGIYTVADLPFEYCVQKNGDLLPTGIFGDGPNPVAGDNQ